MSASRTCLITGCSSGFGRETVTLLLEKGWHVIATLRNAEDRKEIFLNDFDSKKGELTLLSLDVTDSLQIQAVSNWVKTHLGNRLDCLINNAGYGLFGALEDITDDQIRRQMEVNFFGLFSLTQQLLPAIRNSRGKIVNLSSVLGYVGMPLTSAYCASKHAVEGLSEGLYYELMPFGVQVALVEPGGHRTQFGHNLEWAAGSGSDSSPYFKLSDQYKTFQKKLVSRPNPVNATQVARVLLELAESKKMPFRVRCGKDAQSTYWMKKLFLEQMFLRFTSFAYRKLFYGQ